MNEKVEKQIRNEVKFILLKKNEKYKYIILLLFYFLRK